MSVSKEFVLAGNATFTIGKPDGTHYTYRVERVEASERWAEAYFVKLLTGPDNTADYTYLGRLDPATAAVTTTFKSRQYDGTLPHRLLNRVLARVWAGDHAVYEAHGYTTHHEGKCGRCGRALTVPTSVESGIGPECARLMGKVAAPAREEAFELSDRPGTDVRRLKAHRDAEGELTHWTGTLDGVKVTVFND